MEVKMDISDVLDMYGIETDTWVRLSPAISEIILFDQDAVIYIDEDQLFYFDTANELMSISKAYGYSKIPLESIESDYGSYKHHHIFDINRIKGFVSTTVMGPYGSYFERTY